MIRQLADYARAGKKEGGWEEGIFARHRFLPRSVPPQRDCFWGSATAMANIVSENVRKLRIKKRISQDRFPKDADLALNTAALGIPVTEFCK